MPEALRRLPRLLGFALCAGLVCAPSSALAQDEAAKKVAKKNGFSLLESVEGDVDADGKAEVVGACDGKRGIQVCVFKKTSNGVKMGHTFEPSKGNKLKSLKLEELFGTEAAAEIVLEVYGDNPDEKSKRIWAYSAQGSPRVVFQSVIFRSKDKGKRAKWEQAPGVIKYGNPNPGWYFEDVDNNGTMEALVRSKPQVLKVKRKDEEPAQLITGVREDVFEYVGDPTSGRYRKRERGRFKDFLPAYEVKSVNSSSTYVEKTILADLKAEALSKAAYAAADGADDIPAPEVDLTPFRVLGADKNLDTAWGEAAKGSGKGEWFEVDLGEEKEIHMVRVVPGCIESRSSARKHNDLLRFEISLDGGQRAPVNVKKPKLALHPAIAVMNVPVGGKKWAKQTLVFFDGKQSAQKVRITIEGARKRGRKNLTCLAEVSVH